jgi:energy-converting hydrogenase Eha subunit B
MVALEAAVIDWLPCVRIASWPGLPGKPNVRGRRYVCSPPRSALNPNDDGYGNGAKKEND